jgi:hypothetical protein
MPKPAATIRFEAKLAKSGSATLLPLPKSVDGKVVEGTANGFPFRAPHESGNLRISAALLKAIGASAGDTVPVELTRIGDEPEVKVPTDLTKALDANPEAKAVWVDVTPMARREWVRWIASAKQEETRKRRIEVGIDKLTGGMRRPCCFPGLNWVTKDHVPPEDTWATLPKAKTTAKR